jgi:uncharacterized protein YbcI
MTPGGPRGSDRTPTRFARGDGRLKPTHPLHEEVVSIPDRSEDTEGPADPENADALRAPPSAEEVRNEISREILRIHEESYGNGAGNAHAYIDDDFVIVVLDDLELLPNEKFLVDHGKQETVLQVRTQYQHAIQASFRAAIERATGRTVVGFASTTSVDAPRFVAEIFKLE